MQRMQMTFASLAIVLSFLPHESVYAQVEQNGTATPNAMKQQIQLHTVVPTVAQELTKRGYVSTPLLLSKKFNEKIFVKCNVGFNSFLLRVDTGCDTLFFDKLLVEQLNLKLIANSTLHTSQGDKRGTAYLVNGLIIGGEPTLTFRTPLLAFSNDAQPSNTDMKLTNGFSYGHLGDELLSLNSAHIDLESDVIYMRSPKTVVVPKIRGSWLVKSTKTNSEDTQKLNKVEFTDENAYLFFGRGTKEYHYELPVLNAHDIETGICLISMCEPKELKIAPRSSAPFAYLEVTKDTLWLCMIMDHKKMKDAPRSKDAYKHDSSFTLYEYVREEKK